MIKRRHTVWERIYIKGLIQNVRSDSDLLLAELIEVVKFGHSVNYNNPEI